MLETSQVLSPPLQPIHTNHLLQLQVGLLLVDVGFVEIVYPSQNQSAMGGEIQHVVGLYFLNKVCGPQD